MLLKEYLEKYGVSKSAFAKRIGKSREIIHLIVNKGHTPKADIALLIEEATEGKVTRSEVLYPYLDGTLK
ncbi:MAG: hypothetical protein K1060chlam2_01281 [Chlamydiae bacterium]|nr:hypothetical protein [Chlamydiota bacterium]